MRPLLLCFAFHTSTTVLQQYDRTVTNLVYRNPFGSSAGKRRVGSFTKPLFPTLVHSTTHSGTCSVEGWTRAEERTPVSRDTMVIILFTVVFTERDKDKVFIIGVTFVALPLPVVVVLGDTHHMFPCWHRYGQ